MEEKLYNKTLKEFGIIALNPAQDVKFKQACIKSIDDNPGADFGSLIIATRIYLNYILKFPEITL